MLQVVMTRQTKLAVEARLVELLSSEDRFHFPGEDPNRDIAVGRFKGYPPPLPDLWARLLILKFASGQKRTAASCFRMSVISEYRLIGYEMRMLAREERGLRTRSPSSRSATSSRTVTNSVLVTTPVTRADEVSSVEAADVDARFAAAVAGFGQVLRGGRYTGEWSIDDAIALAEGARGSDRFGYRSEFVSLARLAKTSAAMAPHRE